jgi:hypothetical protein
MMEYYSAIKEWNPIIISQIDRTWGHYVKQNKMEKGKYFMFSPYVDVKIGQHVSLWLIEAGRDGSQEGRIGG